MGKWITILGKLQVKNCYFREKEIYIILKEIVGFAYFALWRWFIIYQKCACRPY